jgi:predicted Fe-Mo cluster-binding NifX family protein
MKIVISTYKGGLDDSICPTFGRCPTFTLVDSETMEATVRQNPGNAAGGGAGIAASQEAIDMGAGAVITGNCGPNAIMALNQAGIKTYSRTGSVRDAVDAFKQGKLAEISSPVAPHSGMGMGPGRGGGFGRGGRGFGRGRGGAP